MGEKQQKGVSEMSEMKKKLKKESSMCYRIDGDGVMHDGVHADIRMSNYELREAIKYAHETANSMGTANPLYPPWYRHLDALLEIQRGRAAACCLDNSNATNLPRREAE